MTADLDMLDALASKIAARYKKRASWVDFDDMRQTAWVAFAEADRTFDPQVGVPRWKYLERAATLACAYAMRRACSPVSNRNRNTLGKLAEFSKATDIEPDDCRAPERAAVSDAWRARVRDRVLLLAVEAIDGELASPVLLGERTAAEVAVERNVAPMRVYRACRRVRAEVEGSRMLYELARDTLRE